MSKINKIAILFIFILNTVLFAQENKTGILLEKNILPSDSGYNCYISYRIPYSKLFFIKEENKFTARFNFSFEAIDSASGKILREINNGNFTLASYNETKLNDKYYQSVVKLNLVPGTYKIIPIFTGENSGTQRRLPDIRLSLKPKTHDRVFQPLLVVSEKVNCNNDTAFILTNYEGNIPFSSTVYDLIVPVNDTSLAKLNLEITNNDSTIFKGEVSKSIIGRLSVSNCGNNVICKTLPGYSTRNFILKGFSKKLIEGTLKIIISYNNETIKFDREVIWYNKPFTLSNFKFASKLLKYMTDDPEILKISRNESEKSVKIFNDFWAKIDPTPQSSFNELLEEFYLRADYTVKEYSVINGKNGAESDRGRIYIQFGKPGNIERMYSENNSTQEIWYYKNPNRKFIFTDKSGLGNFILENNAL